MKAITSAKDRTGDVTSSLRYAFKANLNSASIAIVSSFDIEFFELPLAISRWSITSAPSCLNWRKSSVMTLIQVKDNMFDESEEAFQKNDTMRSFQLKSNNLNLAADETLDIGVDSLRVKTKCTK